MNLDGALLDGALLDEAPISHHVITIFDNKKDRSQMPYSNIYCVNTSPVVSDSNNSGSDYSDLDDDSDDGNSETKRNDIKNGFIKQRKYKRLTYNDIVKLVSKYYDIESKYANELDILATYLNGQKTLYLHSQYIAQHNLNLLNIPCIVLTAVITIFAPFIFKYFWSAILVSIMNAFVLLFISIINYLKLESSADMYLHISKHYAKLESSLTMASNKMMFIENTLDQDTIALAKIKEFETQLDNIRDSYTITIPISVKRAYPMISYINIFSFIKKMEHYKKSLIIKFKDIKNEINYILYKWSSKTKVSVSETNTNNENSEVTSVSSPLTKEKHRLEYLYVENDKIKNELIQFKNAYNYIDDLFMREIKQAEASKTWVYYFWYHSPPTFEKFPNQPSINPVIEKYLKFIFNE
jgi:hypothetical protein